MIPKESVLLTYFIAGVPFHFSFGSIINTPEDMFLYLLQYKIISQDMQV